MSFLTMFTSLGDRWTKKAAPSLQADPARLVRALAVFWDECTVPPLPPSISPWEVCSRARASIRPQCTWTELVIRVCISTGGGVHSPCTERLRPARQPAAVCCVAPASAGTQDMAFACWNHSSASLNRRTFPRFEHLQETLRSKLLADPTTCGCRRQVVEETSGLRRSRQAERAPPVAFTQGRRSGAASGPPGVAQQQGPSPQHPLAGRPGAPRQQLGPPPAPAQPWQQPAPGPVTAGPAAHPRQRKEFCVGRLPCPPSVPRIRICRPVVQSCNDRPTLPAGARAAAAADDGAAARAVAAAGAPPAAASGAGAAVNALTCQGSGA